MSKPIVAVVGRPNVGKSTLFNKLVGKRISIVEDTPGVTRDRIYASCEWLDRSFMLVDTGGIEPHSDDPILAQMRRQAEVAIESADVIILATDLLSGVTATDQTWRPCCRKAASLFFSVSTRRTASAKSRRNFMSSIIWDSAIR